MGHVVPNLAVASLIGIRPLCKAGCTVTFDDDKCNVIYDGKVILRGFKDAATDLWTLPLKPGAKQTAQQRSAPACNRSPLGPIADIHPGVDIATFTHSVKTRANGVKFAHQSLGNPKISTLLKAVRRGFLKGCPNSTEKLILKYLNPSPATVKGHMKRPRQGIRSTQRTPSPTSVASPIHDAPTIPIIPPPPAEWIPLPNDFELPPGVRPNMILDDDESLANVFCYGAFADKRSGVV